MTPSVTTTAQWDQVTSGLVFFWAFVASVVVFAACLLLAHAMIPSLVSTRQLPGRALAVRPVFYVLSFLALIAAALAFANIVTNLRVLFDLYGKIWI